MKTQTYSLTLIMSLAISGNLFTQSNWPVLNGNPQRTNYVANENQLQAPLEKETDISIWGEYMLYVNDTIYVASNGNPNTIEAYDIANKTQLWKFEMPGTSGSVGCTPAISGNLIFFGGQKGSGLYAFNRITGEQKWVLPTGSQYARSPLVDGKGHVFINTITDFLLCLNENTGDTIWSAEVSGYFSPSLYDNKLFVCTYDHIIAYDSKTGNKLWEKEHSKGLRGQVLVDESGAYLSVNNTISSFNSQTGDENWNYQFPDTLFCGDYNEGSSCLTDSVLCVSIMNNSFTNGRLLTINKFTGEKLWEYISEAPFILPPVGANSYIYTNIKYNNWLGAFDQMTGDIIFTDSSQRYFGLIIANHRLFTLSEAGVTIFKKATSSANNYTNDALSIKVYPNPSTENITISYDTPKTGNTNISLFDINGNKIKLLYDKIEIEGEHKYILKTHTVKPGIYLIVIKNNDFKRIKKIVILKHLY